jgi:hypothetical protein
MKSFSQKRLLSPSLFFLAVGALIHCGSNDDETSFSTQGDTAVMAGIVGTWMGSSDSGNTYALILCEDTSAASSTKLSCQTLHTVRGGGRGTTETVSKPEGCGGCNYDNSAFVTGTIEGSDLSSTRVDGQFGLTGGDTNGLGFPYETQLEGATANESVSISGSVPSAGELDVDSFYYTPTAAADLDAAATDSSAENESDAAATTITKAITFHRVGDATCP